MSSPMHRQLIYSIFFIFALIMSHKVYGFSTGGGSCVAGEAAIGTAAGGSTHIRSGQIEGPLFDYGCQLLINDVVVEPDTPTTFPPNVDLTWTVRTFNPIQYKGIFIRAEAPESIPFTFTSTETLLKEDTVWCPAEPGNVLGISHNSNVLKASSFGVLRFDGTGTATLDITVVYRNGFVGEPPDNQSITGYNRFTLNIGTAQVPVEAPVAVPIEAPVVVPTKAPVLVPIEAPVVLPIEAPVVVPTKAPVLVPIEAPVVAPTEAPMEAPTEAPTSQPIETPEPTETPIEAPVEAPIKPTNPPKVTGMGMMDEKKGTGMMDEKKGMGKMKEGEGSKGIGKKDSKGMGKQEMKVRFLR